ncbi:LytR family transcriptional regulator, partial [Streptomyces sp. ISL-11]|nr:LytR family transcriptional regulator [Streptomyces sp. ISL-11]
MSDWPDGRTDERRSPYGQGSTRPEPEGARAMPHVRRPAPPRQYQPSPGYDDGPVGRPPGAGHPDDGYNTGQVYGHGGPGGPARGSGG